MISTLLITVIVEGLVVLAYCSWRTKPIRPILFTSIIANLITQSFLWLGLNFFFQQYLVTLCFAEILIWLVESFLLYRFPANQLSFQEAVLISLIMNLTSFALGWFLPI